MKKGDIFLGTVNVYDYELQQMCPLYKINDEYYANLEWMYGLTDYFQLLMYTMGISKAPDFVLSSTLYKDDGSIIYVDTNSLVNFYGVDEFEQPVTIVQAQNDWVSDPRVPVGREVTDKGMAIYKRMKKPKKN